MSKKRFFWSYLFILIGTFIMAIATNIFYESNNIVTGGFTGLSIVIRYLSGKIFGYKIPLWLTTLVLNIPLLIWGFKCLGKKFIFRTLLAIGLLSGMLYLTRDIKIKNFDDIMISALYGGFLNGIGLGLVFRNNSSTGGSDLIASIVNSKYKHISVARILFLTDAIIISSGLFVFGIKNAMYAIIAEFITSRVLDLVLEGFIFSKSVFIISREPDLIASEILNNLKRGVTSLKGQGMYTREDKNVLFCVLNAKEIFKLKSMIKEIDENAFIIVNDAHEVLGNGFRQLN